MSRLAALVKFAGRLVRRADPTPRPKPHATRYRRPFLESLEDRTVPSVAITYGGGPTISHVQVNNIVMGSQSVNTTSLTQMLVSDYLPMLGRNYGIGAGTLRSTITLAPLPGSPSNIQIQNLILQEINSGAVPPPDGNQAYLVFLAPSQVVSGFQGTDTGGYHSGFYVTHDASGYHPITYFSLGTQVLPIYYGVSFGTDPTSIIASHELAEIVTDPSGSGYRDPTQSNGGEVADIYEFASPLYLNGYPVSILSDPHGQKMAITPTATPQDVFALAVEQIKALAFHYASMLNPLLAPYAQSANAELNGNWLYGTPEGQIGVMLGEIVFSNWLSQQQGG